jgi:hypothetical protein
MADSQVPWGVNALNGAVTEPAWKTKRSWYLVATDDKMIPPPAQQQMAKRAKSTATAARRSQDPEPHCHPSGWRHPNVE